METNRSEPDIGMVDLTVLATGSTTRRPAWAHQSADLNVNLLVLDTGDGVAAHVNAEVDVLLVGVAGEGHVEVDGVRLPLGPGRALVVPKGARRAISNAGDRFAYLSCHRRRADLWPTGLSRSAP